MGKFRDLLANRLAAPPSVVGLVLGAAAFLAALTPSLIPRDGPIQGAISGAAFAAAYGLGAAAAIVWQWLGLSSSLEDLFRDQAQANGIQLIKGRPLELRCVTPQYGEAVFMIFWPHDEDRLHMLAPKEFQKGKACYRSVKRRPNAPDRRAE